MMRNWCCYGFGIFMENEDFLGKMWGENESVDLVVSGGNDSNES
jgi:hypothetical protein